jgi:hypothetical protein
MRRPKESGRVPQFVGKRCCGAGERREPGESGLIRPSMKTAATIRKQDMMPRMEVKERKRRGRKESGTRMIPQTIFQDVRPSELSVRALRESAKRTTSATQVARSSRENRIDVATRALGPNETYARSAKVMRLLSTSRHLARILAV